MLNGGDPNLYGYVFNNPINLIDPSGKCTVCVGAVAGAVAGAIGGAVGEMINGGSYQDMGRSALNGAIAGAGGGLGLALAGEMIGLGYSALDAMTGVNNGSDFGAGVQELSKKKNSCPMPSGTLP